MRVGLLGPRVSLTVDNLRKSQALVSRLGDYSLGNNTINSYVYIGGLPPWWDSAVRENTPHVLIPRYSLRYAGKLKSLALPSVVFEPRLRGEVRESQEFKHFLYFKYISLRFEMWFTLTRRRAGSGTRGWWLTRWENITFCEKLLRINLRSS